MSETITSFFERECARIARRPPLSEQEERALAKRWLEHGDRAAAHALVESAMPVVLKLARRLRGYGIAREELISEGNLGLLRAVEKFDLRGVRFKTYATYWIRAYMLATALHGTSMVTRATGAVGAKFFFKLRSARARAEALLGPDTEAVDEVLARQFGVTVEVIQQHTSRLSHGDLSLDAPVGEDGDMTMLDGISASDTTPEEEVAWAERDERVHGTVRRLWNGLDERERAVVKHRLLDDDAETTLSELGARFGLSRERLRQIESRVKDRLRRAMEAEQLTLH
ncbi:MAG: sigma-70 family RNA polymerase sigma factor [Myxococcota bacterium]